jgi:hypothetical protein
MHQFFARVPHCHAKARHIEAVLKKIPRLRGEPQPRYVTLNLLYDAH